MAGAWMRARQTKYIAYATVYVLVILTLVAVANFLANRYNKTYDTTANKRYTLSEQTAKIVQGLKEDATITYFDQTTKFDAAKDLLDRYANLSSKVHVKYVDPDKAPQVARAANITAFGTTLVQVGAKAEVAKSLTETDISGALIRDLKSGTRTVCFATGSGEHRIDDSDRNGYSQFKDALGKDNYASRPVSLLEKAEVPADCTVLVVAGPGSDYLAPEVDAIKKYVEGGGRALVMLDAPLKIGRPVADNDALASMLQGWGVTLEKDMLLDMNPVGQLAGLGPQVTLVTTYGRHEIVNDMAGNATGFPLSRSIVFKNTDKTAVEKLFDSSDTSFATQDLKSTSVNTSDPKNLKGPLTIAVAGTYTSDKQGAQGRFVVVGSSSWAANSFLTFNGNGDFAMNSINWLASDEDLISIRPRDQENRPIIMTRSQLNWVALFSQILLPLVVIVAGVSVWRSRR